MYEFYYVFPSEPTELDYIDELHNYLRDFYHDFHDGAGIFAPTADELYDIFHDLWNHRMSDKAIREACDKMAAKYSRRPSGYDQPRQLTINFPG